MRHTTYTRDARDYEGYGVYEHVGRPHRRAGLGQVPGLESLLEPVYVKGLARVPTNMQQPVLQVMEALTFQPVSDPELGGVSGTAAFVLGTLPTDWVNALVAQGLVVMVRRDTVQTAALHVVATSMPHSVVLLAGAPLGAYVIVAGPPGVIAQAEAVKAGEPPPPQPQPPPAPPGEPPPVTPPGTTTCAAGQLEVNGKCYPHTPPCGPGEQEVYGRCFPELSLPAAPPTIPGIPTVPGLPIPGLPGSPPAPTAPPGAHAPPCGPTEVTGADGLCYPPPGGVVAPAKAGLPSWVLPVAIGAGLLGVGALVLRKRRLRPNGRMSW